jgi:hypothetical protein
MTRGVRTPLAKVVLLSLALAAALVPLPARA